MTKTRIDENKPNPTAATDENRPTRRPARQPQIRPDAEDVVRLEHERHKILMDLLAK
ncbi:hypothetical protein [Rhizobium sp. AG855]|uniref:hypothetical protein n=1 Tax=Rhizobium sp. AG855 TaxID=2183898 RepID=UPI000FF1EC72|nr:hypothetical protein [Rhizobium sp. AG855]RKE85485.1 hypothetical protein DFO46_2283 [Rhizobium sp. AG855]